MSGRSRSRSDKPVARSMARAGARFTPSVNARLRHLSGLDGLTDNPPDKRKQKRPSPAVGDGLVLRQWLGSSPAGRADDLANDDTEKYERRKHGASMPKAA